MNLEKQINETYQGSQVKEVEQTYNRLLAIDISSEVALKYIDWAYRQSLSSNKTLDIELYRKHLFQLPSTLDPKQLSAFKEPVVIKEMKLEEVVRMFSKLLTKEQPVDKMEIGSLMFLMTLGDGFELMLSALENVSVNQVVQAIAGREGIEYDSYSLTLHQDDQDVVLDPSLTGVSLSDIDFEESDVLEIGFIPSKENITLEFIEKRVDLYQAVEIFQKM